MPRSRTPSTSTACRSCRRTISASPAPPSSCRARSGARSPPNRRECKRRCGARSEPQASGVLGYDARPKEAPMKRREFVKGIGVAGGLAALPWHALLAEAASAQAQAAGAPAPEAMAPESRKAWAELMALVAEAERRTLSAEWNVRSPQDVIDGHRVLLHLLAASIDLYLEGDPERPWFVPMPSPTRKYLGDNPDALYYFTVLRGDRG